MKTLPLSSKPFATACLAAHRRHLSRREEEVLEKVIAGVELSPDYVTQTSGNILRHSEMDVYRALRNQYLGELSR